MRRSKKQIVVKDNKTQMLFGIYTGIQSMGEFVMKGGQLVLVVFVGLLVFVESVKADENAVDILFKNGKIYTVNDAQPWADTVAVKDNKIVFVGKSSEAKGFIGDRTVIVDLKENMMLPGFVEAHSHLISGPMAAMVGVDIGLLTTKEKIYAKLREYAKENPGTDLVRGGGWEKTIFAPEGPSKEVLDEIFGDRPVALTSEDRHQLWVSSNAYEVAGVTKKTPDINPPISYYAKNKEGELSGVVVESESTLPFLNAIGYSSPEFIQKLSLEYLNFLAKNGVTSAFDHGALVIDNDQAFTLLQNYEKQGKLTVRIKSVLPSPTVAVDPIKTVTELTRLNRTFKSELFGVHTLKMWFDGEIESKDASVLHEYLNASGHFGNTTGSVEELTSVVLAVDAAHMDVALHVNGDQAVRWALDAFEEAIKKNPKWDRRHSLHHMALISPEDYGRFKELNIIANSTPSWFACMNTEYYVELFGAERMDKWYPFTDLLKAGARITFGGDLPSADVYMGMPLPQMQVVRTRKFPGIDREVSPECSKGQLGFSMAELIKSYTINGAYHMRLEDKIGSIEVGKRADFVVLNKNILEVDPYELTTTKVLLTMMNGRITHGNTSLNLADAKSNISHWLDWKWIE
jgi:predicted amidohydrolase YtcJ